MPIPRPAHHPAAQASTDRFHPDLVQEVASLIAEHDVVVVGMGWNPHVKRAKTALTKADIAFTYREVGNYSSDWKPRLALKMWSGWPTFPAVFVKGALLGGANQTEKAIESGDLAALLQG
jgi:glutaredoxin-related protein